MFDCTKLTIDGFGVGFDLTAYCTIAKWPELEKKLLEMIRETRTVAHY